jgi:hypothetical protein
MAQTYLSFKEDCVMNWQHLGVTHFEDGSLGINDPKYAHNNLHIVLAPFFDDEIQAIEQRYKVEFSDDLREFYRFCGGMYLFGSLMSFGGLNRQGRVPQDYQTTGVSLHVLNGGERPDGSKHHYYYFGLLNVTAQLQYPIFYDLEKGKVFETTERYKVKIGRSWETIPEFLITEFQRYEKYFDRNGKQYKTNMNWLP